MKELFSLGWDGSRKKKLLDLDSFSYCPVWMRYVINNHEVKY